MSLEKNHTRLEHDLLGEREVDADAYYGIHTLRAIENFPISGTPIKAYPELVKALASVKKASALANYEFGLLDAQRKDAIRYIESFFRKKQQRQLMDEVAESTND